jgi:hypothetical protein
MDACFSPAIAQKPMAGGLKLKTGRDASDAGLTPKASGP